MPRSLKDLISNAITKDNTPVINAPVKAAPSNPLPWETKEVRMTPEQVLQKPQSESKVDLPFKTERAPIKIEVKPKKQPIKSNPVLTKGKVKPIDKPAPKRESITPKAKAEVVKNKAATPTKAKKVPKISVAVAAQIFKETLEKKGNVNASQKKDDSSAASNQGKAKAPKSSGSTGAKGSALGKKAATAELASVKKEVNKPKTMKKIIDAVSDRKASPKEIGKKVADIVVEAKNVATNKEIVINAKNIPVQDKKVPSKAVPAAEKSAPKKAVLGKGKVSADSVKAKPTQSDKAAGKAVVKTKINQRLPKKTTTKK